MTFQAVAWSLSSSTDTDDIALIGPYYIRVHAKRSGGSNPGTQVLLFNTREGAMRAAIDVTSTLEKSGAVLNFVPTVLDVSVDEVENLSDSGGEWLDNPAVCGLVLRVLTTGTPVPESRQP